ncbi:MAG: rRNA pseudouridine synthase [Hyphomicrobiaceae bacterium]|nr:rRNA pseudouridine synthase [Hyphomicrobiaceae bacterium]
MGEPQKPARKKTTKPLEKREGDRIAKVMARRGAASRRQAEQLIAEGRVTLNGNKVSSPALNVTESDDIRIDGERLAERQGTRVWLYHKPSGKVVTESDPEGRETIFADLEAKGLPRVVTVGRLDINTEGLLLLTNDGGLKRVLELPSTGWLRRYRVRAHGRVTQAQLDKLRDGMTIEGIQYGPIEASLDRMQGGNAWINLALREGKNREVKNVLGALGLQVNRLIRVSYGPFQLGDLPVGEVSTVKSRVLADQLGKRLAEEAGVDFAAPMPAALAGRTDVAPRKMMPRDLTAPRVRRPKRQDEPEEQADRPRGKPRGRILFDDGRKPEYVEVDEGRKPGRAGGKPVEKGGRPPRPGSDRPQKSGFARAQKPRSDRDSRQGGDRPGKPRTGRPQSRPGKPR